MPGTDMKFVQRPFPHTWNKSFPNPGIPTRTERMPIGVPVVERTEYGYTLRFRCPDGEIGPLNAVHRNKVRAKLVVEVKMGTLIEEIEIIQREKAEPIAGESLRRHTHTKWASGLVMQQRIHAARVLCEPGSRQRTDGSRNCGQKA